MITTTLPAGVYIAPTARVFLIRRMVMLRLGRGVGLKLTRRGCYQRMPSAEAAVYVAAVDGLKLMISVRDG
jgi:hypothetical protein